DNATLRKSMPQKIRPDPASAKPVRAVRPCANILSNAPMAIRGKATCPIENFKPKKATIQPVLVVPILAPIITPMACEKESTPALTKPMVASVVAVEDCTIKVKATPEVIALKGEPVNRPNHCLNVSPAISLRLSVIKVMPSKNKPIPPQSCVNTSNTQIPRL